MQAVDYSKWPFPLSDEGFFPSASVVPEPFADENSPDRIFSGIVNAEGGESSTPLF